MYINSETTHQYTDQYSDGRIDILQSEIADVVDKELAFQEIIKEF